VPPIFLYIGGSINIMPGVVLTARVFLGFVRGVCEWVADAGRP
jgi:hypothetical protein